MHLHTGVLERFFEKNEGSLSLTRHLDKGHNTPQLIFAGHDACQFWGVYVQRYRYMDKIYRPSKGHCILVYIVLLNCFRESMLPFRFVRQQLRSVQYLILRQLFFYCRSVCENNWIRVYGGFLLYQHK